MLRELDKQLIQEELDRQCKRDSAASFVSELWISQEYIFHLFDGFFCREMTEHYYDAAPPECETCETKECENCQIDKDYQGSEAQLRFNNWIEPSGDGIWFESQEVVDKRARAILEGVLDDNDLDMRLWKYNDGKFLSIYYYNRDRKQKDYWWIFERRS